MSGKKEGLIEHHIHYKEIDGYDETVLITPSEHRLLHNKLRREGKCNIPPKELEKISRKAYERTEKSKMKRAEYREDNQEKMKTTRKIYREENKERIAIKQKEWGEKNKDKVIACQERHKRNNPDYYKDYYQRNKDKWKGYNEKT